MFNLFQKAYHGVRGPDEHRFHEYSDRYEFLRKAFTALKYNGITGDYAEFGCCGAFTFCMVHKILTHYPAVVGPFHMWAFDSFEGLPEAVGEADEHPVWAKGNFSMSLDAFHKKCKQRGVPRSAYTTVQGFYEQSLVPDTAGPRPSKIRLAYIDCDMYSSTKAVLEFLMPRLQHGMILAFDDYYCWSSKVPSGERLGAAEIFGDADSAWRLLPYVQYGWAGMSFVVESASALNGRHNAYW
jgi:hypothetical protein